jgi:hypothetical protein
MTMLVGWQGDIAVYTVRVALQDFGRGNAVYTVRVLARLGWLGLGDFHERRFEGRVVLCGAD